MTPPIEPSGRIRPGFRAPRRALGLGGILACAVVLWAFRAPIQDWIVARVVLLNPSPSREVLEEAIDRSSDPFAAIVENWRTGRIVHREVAMQEASKRVRRGLVISPAVEALLLEGAADADMNVRESALGALSTLQAPLFSAAVVRQLREADPELKLLGLQHLRRAVAADTGMPVVMSLLSDPDLRVVGMSLKLAENWSGQEFGVRLSVTAQTENATTGLKEFQAGSLEKVQAGVDKARGWWAANRDRFSHVDLAGFVASLPKPGRVMAPDFSLKDMAGNPVRLSAFRGRVVLINFWTTWCTACVAEMPELIALQRSHGDRLAIVGVSLDYVPDSHGHIGAHDAATGHHDDEPEASDELAEIRRKILRAVQTRGLNYPVLLDEKNAVGGLYNGGELPTTILIDAEGVVRRRFVGARSLPVFEAMIREAEQAR
jgi:thiol-disulfide isomerase/thioredoxin